jgi:hypothetical protein
MKINKSKNMSNQENRFKFYQQKKINCTTNEFVNKDLNSLKQVIINSISTFVHREKSIGSREFTVCFIDFQTDIREKNLRIYNMQPEKIDLVKRTRLIGSVHLTYYFLWGKVRIFNPPPLVGSPRPTH